MAFPVPATDSNYFYEGMSLRDYFAAKAMQGICSHTDTWGLSVPEIANKAYWIANEMLAARSK
ncbi:TPA: hypothetical protein PXP39_004154 [Yersinia enterocolitica]|nr:hypothetical protein [Yersinia enterocolitica]HDL7834201.1 hypothetical protein [Yersinia enterocolitica]HDL7875053.1 hypothetical protein [Yersinia enterocolitica]HDL7887630.1 hypothetical protein [Yersinia enterocolitica]HDL7896224.1 hypothetical protein [Yersinia enterocolitica]